MSGCVELQSSMTGSRREGPLQPPEDSTTLPAGAITSSSSPCSSYSNCHLLDEAATQLLRRQQAVLHQKKMTPVRLPSGQPVQLTPLWEHVVRTQQFPGEVDIRETFDEISERLRDPEWEVSQHALRVLIDVLPTLDADVVDEAMISVLPELINNLGHLAPAVRKGALDSLRVYLVCSQQREEIVTRILDEGLTGLDAFDNFQTNVTLGVILSTPSLLFPSLNRSRPSRQILRQAISKLAMHLIPLAHQEASVRSLLKIHEIIGNEEFDSYLNELDANAKRDYELLCDVYKVKPRNRNSGERNGKKTKRKKDVTNAGEKKSKEKETERRNNELNKNCQTGNGCCIFEENEDGEKMSISCPMPTARIVLETEIKFNEETAITMTILEEKNEDSQGEESESESSEELAKDEEIALEVKSKVEEVKNYDDSTDAWIEKRKTPRRVHFGGEIVKLRTPDSDDSEIVQSKVPHTRIPLPISPTTKMAGIRPRRSVSTPSSPNVMKSRLRKSRSASNSPKREFYTHDASLSPKKSILAKSNSSALVNLMNDVKKINPPIVRKIHKSKVDQLFGQEEDDRSWAFEVCDGELPADSQAQKFEPQNYARNNRDVIRNNRNLSKMNTEVGKMSKIGDTQVKEDLKVEKIVLVGGSLNDNITGRFSPVGTSIVTSRRKNSLIMNIEPGRTSETGDNEAVEDVKEEKIKLAGDSVCDDATVRSSSVEESKVTKKRRNSLKSNTEVVRSSKVGGSKVKEDRRLEEIEVAETSVADDVALRSLAVEKSEVTARKRSLKLNTEMQGTTKISCGEVKEDVKIEKDELVTDDTVARSLALENSKVTKRRRNSLKINLEVGETNEIGGSEVKEEKLELAAESVIDDTAESSVAVEKQEKTGEGKEESNEKDVNEKDSRGGGETLESSGEMKASECRRRSPRSPKKLAFESFPRKERNYILMELSSPIKANGRKSPEIDGDKQFIDVSVNGEVLSRGNSPMRHSADHLFALPSVSAEADNALENKNLRTFEKGEKEATDDEGTKEKKKSSLVESTSPVPKFRESNWEELGLVNQEVLNDLHNKDDWRARVRGLERVASALRTSSALIAIESRLGSLLQTVLGGERSCRVAAAGMAVARVVVAGVSEEALKRRLPQVAWGLARQGGPNAAQLARVAMLRLRPALFLEQLLQPHCIRARNAKTRENTLQLLIFSLVTFPSTEFKVENVGNKVATMVADRRRRVRQAALDTLAVLAQIYEPEEVMQAGKLAAKGQQDGDAMLAAIRARLARKSLPMVSADGLIVYGLQISPTVQIATGPDVDWIVAGSGSVSPGTGRTRGQIIASTGPQDKNSKNEMKSGKNVSNSKIPNFVAVGVGLESKNEQHQPFAWQLFQPSAQDECNRIKDKLWEPENRGNNSAGKTLDVAKSRLTGSLRYYRSATDRLSDSSESEATPIFLLDDKDVIMKQRKTEDNFHRRMDEIYADRTGIGPTAQDLTANRLESRIPVPQSRDREINGRGSSIGTSYTRRKNQEGNNSQNCSASSRGSEASRPHSTQRNDDHLQPEVSARRHQRLARDNTPERLSPTRYTYRSIYQQRRGFADGNVYREVQTAPTTTSYDVSRRRQSLRGSEAASRMMTQDPRRISMNTQTTSTESRSRRLANGVAESYRLLNPSVFSGDKAAVDEEDHNEINKRHFSCQTNPYRIQNLSDRSVQFPAPICTGPSETSSNDSSNTSGEDGGQKIHQKLHNDRQRVMESFVASEPELIRASRPQSPILEKSFDIITHERNPSRKNSIDYGISENEALASTVVYSMDPENEEYKTDKGSSTDDASVVPGVLSCQGKFVGTRIHEGADDDDDDDESSEIEEPGNYPLNRQNVAATSFISNESNSSDEGFSKVSDNSPASNVSRDGVDATSNLAKSPSEGYSVYAVRSIESVVYDNLRSSSDENDGPESTVAFVREYSSDMCMESETMRSVIASQVSKDSGSVREAFSQQSQEGRSPLEDESGLLTNTISILVASRPHSREPSEYEEASFQSLNFRQPREITAIESPAATKVAETSTRPLAERAVNESQKKPRFTALPDDPAISLDVPRESSISSSLATTTTTTHGKIDQMSNIGNGIAVTVPEVIETQSITSESTEAQKRIPTSKVPRIRQKPRTNVSRVAPMQMRQNPDKTPLKSKPITQQCFAQLESSDWEVTVKGLKALSQIARQHTDQLDSCAPGTLGRLLGRHVRNLRSQVSRAACLAAGDVFAHARCIDQDLDDIAGPLLHRTADTNKFLRADSNEALDRMVEHFPPNKTIGVIVHRGATHQNAIVRAATARLLVSIVDRLGPDWPMFLPRDVREKLIATGAKLLMDGNLEARNHAKRMIRKLACWEGFRKALTDSVPETTLRHIDKTLKSL